MSQEIAGSLKIAESLVKDHADKAADQSISKEDLEKFRSSLKTDSTQTVSKIDQTAQLDGKKVDAPSSVSKGAAAETRSDKYKGQIDTVEAGKPTQSPGDKLLSTVSKLRKGYQDNMGQITNVMQGGEIGVAQVIKVQFLLLKLSVQQDLLNKVSSTAIGNLEKFMR